MNQPIDPALLTMIRCPVTKSSLSVADSNLIESINKQIDNRQIVNRIGQTVESSLDGGLLNADRTLLLPIRDGIVVLVSDQAISLTGM